MERVSLFLYAFLVSQGFDAARAARSHTRPARRALNPPNVHVSWTRPNVHTSCTRACLRASCTRACLRAAPPSRLFYTRPPILALRAEPLLTGRASTILYEPFVHASRTCLSYKSLPTLRSRSLRAWRPDFVRPPSLIAGSRLKASLRDTFTTIGLRPERLGVLFLVRISYKYYL